MIDESVYSFLENEFDIKTELAHERKIFAFKRKGLFFKHLSQYDFILNIKTSSIQENIKFFLELVSCIDLFVFFETDSSIKILLSFEKGMKQDFIAKLNRIGQTLEREGFLPRENKYSNEYFLVECGDRLLKRHRFPNLPKKGCSGVDTLEATGSGARSAEDSVIRCLDFSDDAQTTPINAQVAPIDATMNPNDGDAEETHHSEVAPSFFIKLMSHHKLALLLCAGIGFGACSLLYFGVSCLPVLGVFAAGVAVGFFAASAKKSNAGNDFMPANNANPLSSV